MLSVLIACGTASKRLFSVTYLRSTMSQPRLNHAMVLNIYKELVDNLDMPSVATEFVGNNEHRLRLFGSLTVSRTFAS